MDQFQPITNGSNKCLPLERVQGENANSCKVLLQQIREYRYDFVLDHLRNYRINENLSTNGLVRGIATTAGNNCLLHVIFQQICTFLPDVRFPDFANAVRVRIGLTNSEQLSINDEVEGTQILLAIQDYLHEQTQNHYRFDLTVLFADNDGEIAPVDMASIQGALNGAGDSIPLRMILVNFNHYEPLFNKGDPLPNLSDSPLVDLVAQFADINLNQQHSKQLGMLPTYVLNMPSRVESDDEGDASSDEEINGTYPEDMFLQPYSYFRLLPKPEGKGSRTRRGTIISPSVLPNNSRASQKKGHFASLLPLFEREISPDRLGISLGLNKMRSLSQRRNGSLQRRLNEATETKIPIRKIGFLWDGIWQKRVDQTTWRDVNYDEVHHFYRQLKRSNPVLAQEFRGEVEKQRAHMVPYREVRDTIKNHEATKDLTRLFRSSNPQRDVYIVFFDDDIKSFHQLPGAPGAFSVFDDNYLSSGFEICSTGYTIRDPKNPVLEVGVLADLAVRKATAKHLRRGVYYPEPCTAVKIPIGDETILEDFSNPRDKNYQSPKEMPQLIAKVINTRNLDPQRSMIFDGRGAIVTALPTRMQRTFSCRSTQRNGIILWGLSDLRTMRGLNQSHFNPNKWAKNLLPALTLKPRLEIGAYGLDDQRVIQDVIISLLSRLFSAFDPVALAERASQAGHPFQLCLINILNNYQVALTNSIPTTTAGRKISQPRKNAKDQEAALRKCQAINILWQWADGCNTLDGLQDALRIMLLADSSGALRSAAQESGQNLVGLFNQKLSKDYWELVVGSLAELVVKDAEDIRVQIPELYSEIIRGNSVTKRKLTELGDFYGVTAMHIAALAGNIEVVNWLKKNYPYMVNCEDGCKELIPLDYALRHCRDNGLNLDLLISVCDDDTLDSAQTIICETLDDVSEKVLILDHFLCHFGEDFITDFDGDLFLEAIWGGYTDLATRLSELDNCEDALYDAILEAAPDIDETLMKWASDFCILEELIEDVMDSLCESDQQTFNVNLDNYFGNVEGDGYDEYTGSDGYDGDLGSDEGFGSDEGL